MKRFALAAILLLGCSPLTHSVSGPVPQAPPDTFACLMREYSERGYRVQDADRDAGFLRADKATVRAGILGGPSYFVEVAATVMPTDSGSTVRLEVVPVREAPAGGRSSAGMSMRPQEIEETNAVALACGLPAESLVVQK